MTTADFRRGMRRQVAKSVNYSVTVPDMCASKHINDVGMCSDISAGGLCMTTCRSLEKGHVITFQKQIQDDIPAGFAVVKWVQKIGPNSYRVGVKFA